ncbi:MAG: DUF1593 domain-containing protein, partial [Bacteroidota bacterium]
MNTNWILTWVFICLILPISAFSVSNDTGQKQRVIISSDIGGSDPDDFQSMVHLFLYADTLEIEGLISSPPQDGRKEDILEVINAYEKDLPKLRRRSSQYPPADYLRSITAQGALIPQNNDTPKSKISKGARLIIDEAKKEDPRPLYVLVWGSITDVAQALYKAPEIKEKIRVYFIGSWNTRQDPKARDYVFNRHPDLWFIENNTTFRGMYMGGYQKGSYGNESFVNAFVKDHGALGNLFYDKKPDIKMGDTPSVLYLISGEPANPETESWGGRFRSTDHGEQYWTDIRSPEYTVNGKEGAKTVSR